MMTLFHGPDRRRARSGPVLALAAALAAAIPPAAAIASGSGQAATAAGTIDPPAGWRRSVGQGVDTYQKGGPDAEAVVMVAEVPAATIAEVDAVAARFFTTMGCRDAPPASRDGSVGPFGEGTRCFASFRRSPGGHRIATGAAVSPAAEAEGMVLARRLAAGAAAVEAPTSAGDGVPRVAAASGSGTDAEVDAALRAALDAVPKRNMPVDVTLRRHFRFVGDHMRLDFTVWLLFADGFATSCMEWDPAVLAPTAEALASLERDSGCEIARWRRVGNDAVFDDGEKGDTSLDDGPPPARGTTYAGDFTSSNVKFSSLMNYGVPGELRIDSEAMSLTRDGRFRLGSEMYTRRNLDNETARTPVVTGRYMVDRYLIAMAANGKVERHFFLATGKPEDKELILYLDGRLLSNR